MAGTKQLLSAWSKDKQKLGIGHVKHITARKDSKASYLGLKLKTNYKEIGRCNHEKDLNLKKSSTRTCAVDGLEQTGKRHRTDYGENALREIRKYQKSTNLVIPKIPFQRLVKQVITEMFEDRGYRMQSAAVEALQVYRHRSSSGLMNLADTKKEKKPANNSHIFIIYTVDHSV